jgi:hypothetical protein
MRFGLIISVYGRRSVGTEVIGRKDKSGSFKRVAAAAISLSHNLLQLRDEHSRCAYHYSADTNCTGGGHMVVAMGKVAPGAATKTCLGALLLIRVLCSLALRDALVGNHRNRHLGHNPHCHVDAS